MILTLLEEMAQAPPSSTGRGVPPASSPVADADADPIDPVEWPPLPVDAPLVLDGPPDAAFEERDELPLPTLSWLAAPFAPELDAVVPVLPELDAVAPAFPEFDVPHPFTPNAHRTIHSIEEHRRSPSMSLKDCTEDSAANGKRDRVNIPRAVTSPIAFGSRNDVGAGPLRRRRFSRDVAGGCGERRAPSVLRGAGAL